MDPFLGNSVVRFVGKSLGIFVGNWLVILVEDMVGRFVGDTVGYGEFFYKCSDPCPHGGFISS